jgi:hypothetical protein
VNQGPKQDPSRDKNGDESKMAKNMMRSEQQNKMVLSYVC